MLRRNFVLVLSLGAGSVALGQSGNPNDIYVLSDATSEVYQYERNSPWNYVPGSYSGFLGSPYNAVFSNSTQCQSNNPYLGAAAGPNDNLFVGGFGSLVQIDSSSGAYVSTIAGGTRLGPAKAPNGNIVVGGPSGTEEYDSATGGFVRNVQTSYGGGGNLHCFRGNEMFVVPWGGSAPGGGIQRFDFVTGLPTGAPIPVSFAPQEIGIGPDGGLYATALYEGSSTEGLWRYDFGTTTWTRYIDTNFLTGTGPHGFAWDPTNYDIFMAFQTGEIFRFDVNGNYLNQIDIVPTKFTDILFHIAVPEPASLVLLALGGLIAVRRR
ncbi:MAG: PEP-CTERM sorting domain-containing protein [Planctomycetes bacterium]|nr:PEP-CTERM sorting domain-containing protein [Planctomycetota bacterium]